MFVCLRSCTDLPDSWFCAVGPARACRCLCFVLDVLGLVAVIRHRNDAPVLAFNSSAPVFSKEMLELQPLQDTVTLKLGWDCSVPAARPGTKRGKRHVSHLAGSYAREGIPAFVLFGQLHEKRWQ